MKELEARVVQEGVRAELLEEEFNAISAHISHLSLLGSEIALSGLSVVASEEQENLFRQVAILEDIQEERAELVTRLQATYANEAAMVEYKIKIDKDPATLSFGITVVGGDEGMVPFIDKVVPNGAGARAGILSGDELIAVNERDVLDGSHDEIVAAIIKSGQSVLLTIRRSEGQLLCDFSSYRVELRASSQFKLVPYTVSFLLFFSLDKF